MKLKSKTFLNFGILGENKTMVTFQPGKIYDYDLDDEAISNALEPFFESGEIEIVTEEQPKKTIFKKEEKKKDKAEEDSE